MPVDKILWIGAVLCLWFGSFGCTTQKLSVKSEGLEITWRDQKGMRLMKTAGSWFDPVTNVTVHHIASVTDQYTSEDAAREFRQIFAAVLGTRFFEKIYVDPKLSKLYLDSITIHAIIAADIPISNTYMEVLQSPASDKIALLDFKRKTYALHFQSRSPWYKPHHHYFGFAHPQPGVYVTGVCDPSSEGHIPCTIVISYKNNPSFVVDMSQKVFDQSAIKKTMNRFEIRNIHEQAQAIGK